MTYQVEVSQHTIRLQISPTQSRQEPVTVKTMTVDPDSCSFKWEMAQFEMLAECWRRNHPDCERL